MSVITLTTRAIEVFCKSVTGVFIACLLAGAAAAEPSCSRVDAYWQTNLDKLAENLSECDSIRWHKCSQAAAIHYDLKNGSLAQRAAACGLRQPDVPGSSHIDPKEADSKQCLNARNSLREIFENRALARLACAAAREGGIDQEWLDAKCALHRSQMVNYHLPFRTMAKHCQLDYSQIIALR